MSTLRPSHVRCNVRGRVEYPGSKCDQHGDVGQYRVATDRCSPSMTSVQGDRNVDWYGSTTAPAMLDLFDSIIECPLQLAIVLNYFISTAGGIVCQSSDEPGQGRFKSCEVVFKVAIEPSALYAPWLIDQGDNEEELEVLKLPYNASPMAILAGCDVSLQVHGEPLSKSPFGLYRRMAS